MKNVKRTAIALATILACLVVFDLAFTLAATCSGQPPEQKPVSAQSPQKQCKLSESVTYRSVAAAVRFIERGEKFFIAAATLVIAAFTVILAWSTWGLQRAADQQKRAMRVSLKIAARSAKTAAQTVATMEKNAALELRAYLGVTGGNVRPPANGKIECSVNIPNQGKTPAHNVNRYIDMGVRDIGHSEFGEAPQNPGNWVMVPGAFATLVKEIDITPEDQTAIQAKNPTKTIFVWGKVTYNDVFGKELRVSAFRYRLWKQIWVWEEISGQHGRVNTFHGWGLELTTEGNRST